MKKRNQLFLAVILLIQSVASAQQFDIKKVEITAESIILYYDLIDTTRNRAYVVHVYSSRDQFIAPLQQVNGDLGLEVRPGVNKKIEWNAKGELGSSFEGGVELEIRGRVYIPFIKFDNLTSNVSIKRGVKKKLTWTGGSKQYLNFTLQDKNGNPVETFTNISNSHEYDIVLPKKVKPGSGYTLLVTDSKNKDQAMQSPPFHVSRKVPLAVQALAIPAVVIGTIVIIDQLKGDKNNDLNPPQGPPTDNN